jgi:hypothetical protein
LAPLFLPSFFGFFFSLVDFCSLFAMTLSPFDPALLAVMVLSIILAATALRKLLCRLLHHQK